MVKVMASSNDKGLGLFDSGATGLEGNTTVGRERETSIVVIPTLNVELSP
jgi:hypothetical protein